MTLEIKLSDDQLSRIADIVAAKLERKDRTTYTVKETAVKLKISVRTVDRHIKAGIIPTVQGLVGVTRIPSAYVDNLIDINLGGNGQ